jgi:predicted DNA-binding transcriptional regulator AlpA
LTESALDPWLSYKEVLEILPVSRSTLAKWRREENFPEMVRLPNGELRVRKSVFDAWLESLPDA